MTIPHHAVPSSPLIHVPPIAGEPFWIGTRVQHRIHQILSVDMSSTTIKRCRIAWALDSDSELQGQRSIIAASGVDNMTTKKLLPAEGEQDALGLVRCVAQGQGGVDPLAVRRSRYVAIGNESDPTTIYPITHAASPVSPGQTVDSSVNAEKHDHYGINRCGVPSNVAKALHPGRDVWAAKNMSDLGWSLAVVYGPVNIGDAYEDGPILSLGDLRKLSGKTQQGVHATLKKWDKAEHTVPFRKIESPGKPTTLMIMFGQLVDGDHHYYQRADKQTRLQEQHLAESVTHKQRMTPAGARAWVLATGKEWLWKDETPPVIPAEVLAQGESAVYAHLVAQEEAEKAQEPLAGTVVTQVTETISEPPVTIQTVTSGMVGDLWGVLDEDVPEPHRKLVLMAA